MWPSQENDVTKYKTWSKIAPLRPPCWKSINVTSFITLLKVARFGWNFVFRCKVKYLCMTVIDRNQNRKNNSKMVHVHFSKSDVISFQPWTKFRLPTDFDLRKRMTLPNTKPDVVLRRRSCRLENRRHGHTQPWVVRYGWNVTCRRRITWRWRR